MIIVLVNFVFTGESVPCGPLQPALLPLQPGGVGAATDIAHQAAQPALSAPARPAALAHPVGPSGPAAGAAPAASPLSPPAPPPRSQLPARPLLSLTYQVKEYTLSSVVYADVPLEP